MSNKRDLRKALSDARKKLEREIQAREEIETRIARLKRMIAGMATYVEGTTKTQPLPGIAKLSLKDEIRTALRAIGKPATIADIRTVLKELNYTSIEGHKNPAASAVNILKRLIDDGEVKYGEPRDGKKTYVWVLPVYGAATSLANRMEDYRRDRKGK
jgi:phosphoenolpyruvate carboxylase